MAVTAVKSRYGHDQGATNAKCPTCDKPASAAAFASALQALVVALEHPALSAEPKVMCAAARVCKAWRQAVQQCSACNMHVAVQLEASLEHLSSFARWLPKHAQLLRSLSAHIHDFLLPSTIHQMPRDTYLEVAQMMLQPAMQLAGAWPAAAVQQLLDAAAANQLPDLARALQQEQQQHRQRLRLASFRSNWLCTPAVLAALPAHSLTHLEISPIYKHLNYKVDGPRLTAALQQLSSLQKLHLSGNVGPRDPPFFSSCLPSIPHLPQLLS
jgi:hypothetical protein